MRRRTLFSLAALALSARELRAEIAINDDGLGTVGDGCTSLTS
jgi:hypothetical protein